MNTDLIYNPAETTVMGCMSEVKLLTLQLKILENQFNEFTNNYENELEKTNNNISQCIEKIDFYIWYQKQNIFKKLIWRLKKYDYTKLKTIKDGI